MLTATSGMNKYGGEMPLLVDPNEAALMLEDAVKLERAIDLDIASIIRANDDLDGKLLYFHSTLPDKLQPIFQEAQALLSTITDTCTLAENVSRKVRDLDTIRARVGFTLKKVEDIIDLKHCVDIVKKAMADEDYETAADHIQKYMGFTTGQSGISELEPAQEGHTHAVIVQADQQLKSLIRSKLEQSLANDKQDEIMRFCELYAKLGMKDEGLTRYCHYLRKTCSNNVEKLLKQYLYGSGRLTAAAGSVQPLSAPAALTKLFESVAVIIEDQAPIVDSHFGPGSAITMIRNMTEQCNTHTNRIVELFLENHTVSRKMDFLTEKGKIPEKDRDPRVLTATLDEMVSICKSAEYYMRFITKKVLILPLPVKPTLNTRQISVVEGLNAPAAANQKKLTNSEVATTVNSELNRKVQEIIGFYISLEEYFMVESVQKAIKMDELGGDGLTSIMVDSTFFVLQQSSQRALEAHNVYGLCAVVNHIVKCLDGYKELLIKSFKDQPPKLVPSKPGETKNAHLVVFNNLDVSSEHILRLKSEIEAKTAATGERAMFTKPEDQDKVKTAVTDLADISKRFKQTLDLSMKHFISSLHPRTRALIDLFANVNYEISDQEYANNEINDPFAQLFITEVTSILKPFNNHFTPPNYDLFIHLLALMQKRVNQLGALQFDKDLMTISAHFSSITMQSVRDKFARLSQMANLLTTESISEVNEIWGENSGNIYITWRLTPAEVRKVLMLRVDYPPDQIAKLKL